MATTQGRRRWIYVGLGVLAVALFCWAVFHKPAKKTRQPPATPVVAAKVTAQNVPLTISALGAAQAWRSDVILSQVSGMLLSVNFKEGSFVRQGQVLAQVDPATYQAALTQAQGQLAKDQAVLAEARMDLARYETLLKQDSIARQQADDQAQVVKQDEGTVLLDQGVVANAKVNLERTRILSPISGRAGVRLVDPGNLVSAGASASSSQAGSTASAGAAGVSGSASGGGAGGGIVTINQIQPIAVTFTVPEGDFQRLVEASDHFRTPLAVQAFSQETGALLDSGALQIADNHIDPATGTVQLKASFPNAAQKLWPGQFVNVALTLRILSSVITAPLEAVNRGPNGSFVFVVGPHNKAMMRPVTLGSTQGTTAIVRSGLQSGETVVVDGQMTLKNGSQVRLVQAPPAGATGP